MAVVTTFFVATLGAASDAWADGHYYSLSKVFPKGKCAPVAPNFELLVAGFAGGEMTEHKISDGHGGVTETITTFISKDRDQWVIVGPKRNQKVIFCLYASGVGEDLVARRALEAK